MADEDSREDVTRAVEQSWYLVILQMEVAVIEVVVANYCVLTVDLTTRDKG